MTRDQRRSPRRVADMWEKDFNKGPKEGLFAAMPHWEARRLLLTHAATNQMLIHKEIEISFMDAMKACHNATPNRRVYVELPPEGQ